MLICKQCKVEKATTEFYATPNSKTGFNGKCKACMLVRCAEYRNENIDRIRDYDKARAMQPGRVTARKQYQATDQGKAAVQGAKQRYADAHPLRRRAVVALNNAVRDGRVIPQPCWVCGKKAEAHHPDYSRPLDVVWLCNPHHRATHKLIDGEQE